jgi:general secretion pathway protein E
VLTTLHTNDAPSAITRLVDMGVEDYLLASSLIGILAQRLVRVNCEHCKSPEMVSSNAIFDAAFMKVHDVSETVQVFRGPGCAKCGFTGYQSRLGIFELMNIDESLRKLMGEKADATVLKAHAIRSGMRTLKEDGWNKIRTGLTTPEEVLRVTQEI